MTTVVQKLINKVDSMISNGGDADLLAVKFHLENSLEAEKEQLINFHIEVMKQGLIEEGDEKWTDAYLPIIREAAEKYYDKLNNL